MKGFIPLCVAGTLAMNGPVQSQDMSIQQELSLKCPGGYVDQLPVFDAKTKILTLVATCLKSDGVKETSIATVEIGKCLENPENFYACPATVQKHSSATKDQTKLVGCFVPDASPERFPLPVIERGECRSDSSTLTSLSY